ncbi:MAG TPA: LuxR C-terminal-related transcriptional regulator [Thermoleophilaceae bacterium]|nr:LuxR C-terminal-related transcriptional regulator [Thermoleophilaceae bacterium]
MQANTAASLTHGMASADIAAQLNLWHGTVRNYLSEAIGKLNAANRIEACRLARQKGWRQRRRDGARSRIGTLEAAAPDELTEARVRA